MAFDRAEFGRPRNITTATTTVVKTGPGTLLSIVVNEAATGGATGDITIYDNTSAAGTVIGTPSAIPTGTTLVYACQVSLGLTIVTASADNLTVVFS